MTGVSIKAHVEDGLLDKKDFIGDVQTTIRDLTNN